MGRLNWVIAGGLAAGILGYVISSNIADSETVKATYAPIAIELQCWSNGGISAIFGAGGMNKLYGLLLRE